MIIYNWRNPIFEFLPLIEGIFLKYGFSFAFLLKQQFKGYTQVKYIVRHIHILNKNISKASSVVPIAQSYSWKYQVIQYVTCNSSICYRYYPLLIKMGSNLQTYRTSTSNLEHLRSFKNRQYNLQNHILKGTQTVWKYGFTVVKQYFSRMKSTGAFQVTKHRRN